MNESNLVVMYVGVIQAAVTVLAIVGALHVTRLTDHMSRLREQRGELQSKADVVGRRYNARRQLWAELRQFWTKQMVAAGDARVRGDRQIEVSEVRDWDQSRKVDGETQDPERYGEHLTARLSHLTLVQPIYEPLPATVTPEQAGIFAAKLRSVLGETSGRLEALIQEDIEAMEVIAADITRLRARAVTGSDFFLLFLLSFVSASGIAVPFTLLGTSELLVYGVSEYAVMGVFGLSIVALNLYFWAQIRQGKELTLIVWPGADAPKGRSRWRR